LSLACMLIRRFVFELVGFFFQAEDGIRDFHVTGVQTCALPIYLRRVEAVDDIEHRRLARAVRPDDGADLALADVEGDVGDRLHRSEERRVGKESRSWWTPYQ